MQLCPALGLAQASGEGSLCPHHSGPHCQVQVGPHQRSRPCETQR